MMSPVDLKLEVIAIPVADVDRAKSFYMGLGWKLDADFMIGKDFRAVQLTPPGSPCSIHLSTTMPPGSARGMFLVVSDVDAARAELSGHSVKVSDVFHFDGDHRAAPGRDPNSRPYNTFASFSDPDGNQWLLQEVTARLPGRGLGLDVSTLTDLLREAENGHGEHGGEVPKHHWSQWYAAYIVSRERGKTADEAATDARHHLEATQTVAPV